MNKIALWRGRPVEEMTRDDLLEMANALAAQAERDRQEHQRELSVLTGLGRKGHGGKG